MCIFEIGGAIFWVVGAQNSSLSPLEQKRDCSVVFQKRCKKCTFYKMYFFVKNNVNFNVLFIFI